MSSRRAFRVDEIRGSSPLGSAEDSTLIVTAVPITENGETLAVLEVYRDVTAEARIQERYKGLLERERQRAATLEEEVKLRTADLERSLRELRQTRAQLIQSEKLSSLGQLVAGIAHEINNPINFIYGNLDFLDTYVGTFQQIIEKYDACTLQQKDATKIGTLKADLDYEYIRADTSKLLHSIRNGAERASKIIQDLRRFIHSGVTDRGPVDVRACIDTTLSLLSHETRKGTTIDKNYGTDVPTIMANEGQLNQVFMNLIANAVQALDGNGTVSISASRRENGVAIGVADNGPGIPEAHLLKVFDPFFTTKPVGKGTGLGLSISYSIVNAHGGSLTAESTVGQGSTFTVWLPIGDNQTSTAEDR
ncbi:MAG: hypothetical protein A2289_10695 [Deltaproteobacteria bacterium RIFOXYA12_FULL_58_15]|nr:MAG: hypothetical protein A2289_10695 [Deltaproteobacteria bacterium RIFOXYA12_FULL_58_15]